MKSIRFNGTKYNYKVNNVFVLVKIKFIHIHRSSVFFASDCIIIFLVAYSSCVLLELKKIPRIFEAMFTSQKQ